MNKLRDHYPILLHPMKIKSKLPLTVTCDLHLDMHDIDWLLLTPTELHKLKLYGFGIESIFSIFKCAHSTSLVQAVARTKKCY